VFGASVGPVMKTFGDVSLHFLNGISPKITQAPQGSTTKPLGVSVPVSEIPSAPSVSSAEYDAHTGVEIQTVPATNGVPVSNHLSNSSASRKIFSFYKLQ
jgi:hypothetical protein